MSVMNKEIGEGDWVCVVYRVSSTGHDTVRWQKISYLPCIKRSERYKLGCTLVNLVWE